MPMMSLPFSTTFSCRGSRVDGTPSPDSLLRNAMQALRDASFVVIDRPLSGAYQFGVVEASDPYPNPLNLYVGKFGDLHQEEVLFLVRGTGINPLFNANDR